MRSDVNTYAPDQHLRANRGIVCLWLCGASPSLLLVACLLFWNRHAWTCALHLELGMFIIIINIIIIA